MQRLKNMNRKLSICIIAALIVLFAFGVWFGRYRQKKEEEIQPVPQAVTEEETMIVASVPTVTYAYIVRATEHMLVVYLGDGQTVYMETGIRLETLDEDMKQKVIRGIGFKTPESLYDFLESYSS